MNKFGLELPKTVEDAHCIDTTTGTTIWCDTIKEEIKNVCVAFDILGDGVVPPPGHQYICCHMIFDIRMEDFWHKALV